MRLAAPITSRSDAWSAGIGLFFPGQLAMWCAVAVGVATRLYVVVIAR